MIQNSENTIICNADDFVKERWFQSILNGYLNNKETVKFALWTGLKPNENTVLEFHDELYFINWKKYDEGIKNLDELFVLHSKNPTMS